MAPASAARRPTLSPSGPRARLAAGSKFAAEPLAVTTASATRSPRAPSFATVKTFWTAAPVRSPVTLSQVSTAITTRATSCAVLKVTPGAERSTWASPTAGTKKPSVLAKATATAATKPVLMARSSVQP